MSVLGVHTIGDCKASQSPNHRVKESCSTLGYVLGLGLHLFYSKHHRNACTWHHAKFGYNHGYKFSCSDVIGQVEQAEC